LRLQAKQLEEMDEEDFLDTFSGQNEGDSVGKEVKKVRNRGVLWFFCATKWTKQDISGTRKSPCSQIA